MSHIFGTDVDFDRNDLSNVRLVGELGFPSVTISDAGLVMFNSGQDSFYGWTGNEWINFNSTGAVLPNNIAYTTLDNSFSTDQTFGYDVSVSGSISTDSSLSIGDLSTFVGSTLTVTSDSTSTGTSILSWIDVNRVPTAESSGETYATIHRVQSNSTFLDGGITGSNSVGRYLGSGGAGFVYGAILTGEYKGSGDVYSVNSSSHRSIVSGTGTGTIDYLRGIGITTQVNNSNTTVNHLQGIHVDISPTTGTIGEAHVLFLDMDDNGGDAVVTGDLSYIYINNDTIPTVNGTSRAIMSASTLPSKFDGSIESTEFSITGGISDQFLTADGSLNQKVARTDIVNNFTQQQHFEIQTLTSGSTVDWDLSSNQKAIISHDQVITLNNPTNMMSGASYVLYLQHGVTASAFTFSSSYKFPSDIAPTLSQGGSSLDIIQFESDGIYMYCINTSLNLGGSSGVADTTPPTNPSTFTAYLGVDAIELSWSDGADNISVDRYLVERLDDVTNTWTILPAGNVSAPTTTLSDTYFLVSGVTYSYRMRTADEANNISTKYKLADADVTYYPA